MVRFKLVGLPEPTPVRNPNNNLVEDGYRLNVESLETGARAVLEIPKSLYSPEYVQRQADDHLGRQDAVVKAFGEPTPSS